MSTQKIAVVGIVEKDGEVLIGKKVPRDGDHLSEAWHIPGGKANPGESPEAALIREIFEETRLHIGVTELIAERQVPEANLVVKWYLCKPLNDQIIAGDDLVAAKFLPKSELRKFCDRRAVSLWPPEVAEYLDK